MSMTLPSMLLGAVLVFLGVLASALADRIRGIRLHLGRVPRELREPREPREPHEPRDHRVVTDAHRKLRADVIAALVQSGFTKPEAAKAVDACPGAVQSTIEAWTRSALRQVSV